MIEWIKKLHTKIYQEEQPVSYTSNMGGGGYFTTSEAQQTTAAANQIYTTTNPQGYQVYTKTPITSFPTNAIQTIAFTDASGHTWVIQADSSHVAVLQSISMHNQRVYCASPPQGMPSMSYQPTHKMTDGDFSFDELSQAEEIISELESANNKNMEATHQPA